MSTQTRKEEILPTPNREVNNNNSTPVLGAVAGVPATGSAPGAGRKGVPRYMVENWSYRLRERVWIGEYVRKSNAVRRAREEFFWGVDQTRVVDMQTQEEVFFLGRAGK